MVSPESVDAVRQAVRDWEDKQEERARRKAASRADAALRQRVIDASIPPRMAEWDAKVGNNPLLEWVRQNKAGSIYIPGVYGCGKTRAIATVAADCARAGEDVEFSSEGALILEIQVAGADPAELSGLRRRASTCGLLVIDDFGKTKYTEFVSANMFEVINARYQSGARTWITTNATGDEMAAKLGDVGLSIVRRLREMCVVWKGQP
jgi:DNA replication protein DnaC